MPSSWGKTRFRVTVRAGGVFGTGGEQVNGIHQQISKADQLLVRSVSVCSSCVWMEGNEIGPGTATPGVVENS